MTTEVQLGFPLANLLTFQSILLILPQLHIQDLFIYCVCYTDEYTELEVFVI